jgi:lipoprotein-releasing system ATP-binding protein
MLHLDAISKSYATRAEPLVILRDVTLSLSIGESLAVMGPSGSGKSTLLNIIGTLEPPSEGRVVIDGVDPFSLSDHELSRFRNRRLGFVFQEHHLLPQCTVLENVLIPTLVARQPETATRAHELLSRVGLDGRLDHFPSELSGGERQRTAIARALINRPGLVLADEPTGNLDAASASQVGDLLAEIVSNDGVALVVVTHNRALSRRFDRVLELQEGRLAPISDAEPRE